MTSEVKLAVLTATAIVIIACLGVFPSVTAQETFTKQSHTEPVASGLHDTSSSNRAAYFQFTVPPDATDAVLSGNYQSYGGVVPGIEVYVIGSECNPYSARSCPTIYHSENRVLGDVSVPLLPGKSYYLIFYNGGLMGEVRQVSTNFGLSYNSLLPQSGNMTGNWTISQ